MTTIGDEQVGGHLLLTFFVHTRNRYIKVLDRQSGNGLVAQMFREPCKVSRKQLDEFLVELVDEIHLSDHYHSFVIVVQTFYQFLVITVVYVQSLITGNHTHFRQFLGCKPIDRFRDRHIDVYRPLSMMSGFQDCFVDESVAMPFVFLRIHFRQVD